MRGIAVSEKDILKMKELRELGNTISEISKSVNRSKSVVSRYIKGVDVLPAYRMELHSKQGGSKYRAKQGWTTQYSKAKEIIEHLNFKEKIILLAGLYWGEGTKNELNIINSDSSLLRVIVHCFLELGVKIEDFRVSIRIYEDVDQKSAIVYWSKKLKLPPECFIGVNILDGKKKGKLQYGMCRIRVRKGEKYFKFIMSSIKRFAELLP